MNRDDVVVLQSGRRAGLAQEALFGVGLLGDFGEHRLQSEGALQGHVFGEEDDTHAALTEHLEDAVGTETTQLVRGLSSGKEGEASSSGDTGAARYLDGTGTRTSGHGGSGHLGGSLHCEGLQPFRQALLDRLERRAREGNSLANRFDQCVIQVKPFEGARAGRAAA